jgi:hypothetical protein
METQKDKPQSKLPAVVKSAQGIAKICTALAAPIPVIADFFKVLSPSWPAPVVVLLISAVTQAMTLGVSFWCWKAGIRKNFKVVLGFTLLVIFVGTVLIYARFYSNYVVTFPNEPEQAPIIIGDTFVRPEIAELVKSDPSTFTNQELLTRNERDPERIWTLDSITRNRIWLLAAWLILWAAPTFFLALFAAPDPKTSQR